MDSKDCTDDLNLGKNPGVAGVPGNSLAGGGERLVEVGEDVVDVLDADREADRVPG